LDASTCTKQEEGVLSGEHVTVAHGTDDDAEIPTLEPSLANTAKFEALQLVCPANKMQV
jgi:hypothetical protein